MLKHGFVACWLVVTALLVSSSAAAEEPETRWVAKTPDEIIDLSLRAALADGPDALARVLMIATFEERASAGKAVAALEKIGASKGAAAGDARWLARMLRPEPAAPWDGKTAPSVADQAGPLVRTFAILGPFEDTGGGLKRKEGPEKRGHKHVGADHAWGVYAVQTRRSLVHTVGHDGLPLDLYVHPRHESCSYLTSVVTVPSAMAVTVNVATGGTFRLMWDGASVITDDKQLRSATVDRAAVELSTNKGEHVLSLKVCTSAQGDSGRVRVRFSDTDGNDLSLPTSSDPSAIDRVTQALYPPKAPVAYKRVPTAMERGVRLSATENPDKAVPPDAALIASVILRLGGADDQRSTRAPGLLDTLVGSTGVSADHLALAGYIAPHVANRSGWLAKAKQRATSEGDAAVLAFAQRALVALRLGTGAVDLAKSTADMEPLASDEDQNARWLRARVLRGLGASGLRIQSRKLLTGIIAEMGGKTPLIVWRDLSRSSAHNAQRLKAMQQLASGTAGDRGPSFVSAHQHLGAATVESVGLANLLHQRRASQVTRIGSALLSAGRYESAAKVLRLSTRLSPNRADAFYALAQAERAMSPKTAASKATVAALERAVELKPSKARLNAELRFRRGDKNQEADPGEDKKWLVAPDVFLSRAKSKPAPKTGVFSRQLHWRRVVRMHPDKRVSQLMHYAREVIVPPRTERERREQLPGGYGSELLLARVHKKNGAVIAPEEQDASGPMVRWPPLERGDVVEVAVRNWTRGPVGRRGDAPFYFADYVGSVHENPILYNDVVIDAPATAPLAFDVVGGKPDEHKSSTVAGRQIDHLIWNAPPTIASEPFAPAVSELMPVVVGSIYPSWDGFLGWYEGAVEGFTTPDEQIKRMAEEITAGKKTREQKVAALFDFVADDIRYVNYQSGEWWLPNRPQHLLARRQGDCDDKAMLLVSLLEAVGVKATEVLIQTRYTAQRRIMQSKKVAIPMFDHGIIYLPNENGEGGRYLDATSPQSRMGTPPGMDSGAMALLVKKGASIRQTATAKPADHGVNANWTLALASDGSGKLEADEHHLGDLAFRLRTHLRQEDARAQWVEQNLVSGAFPGLVIEPKVGFEPELATGGARVTYQAKASSMARREGADLVVATAPPRAITTAIAPLVNRTLPVELPPSVAPMRREVTIEIVAPETHVFAALPPDGVADGNAFGSATLTFALAKNGKSVTVKRQVTLSKWQIPVADYPAWRAWLQKVDGLLQRTVRLSPK